MVVGRVLQSVKRIERIEGRSLKKLCFFQRRSDACIGEKVASCFSKIFAEKQFLKNGLTDGVWGSIIERRIEEQWRSFAKSKRENSNGVLSQRTDCR